MEERTYITIGRQFGSGGREIGKKIASTLGIEYYDKELLAIAAKESGLSHEFLQSYDEKPTNSFLYSLVMGQQNLFSGVQGTTVEQLAAKAQRDAVLSVADKGCCVIVGRCADYILRKYPGRVRVFICSDWDWRVRHVCQRDGVDEKTAEEKMRKMDKSRGAYYNFHTDQNWSAAETYDLCLNSARLGIDGTAETILRFVEEIKKARN